MKLKRGPSRFWAFMHRAKLVHAHMPFWRVVVEARLDHMTKNWRDEYASAVTAVFVWARTIEEAEALASLALEQEGLVTQTADAQKATPAAAPVRQPKAMSRAALGFLPHVDGETGAAGPSRRDARA